MKTILLKALKNYALRVFTAKMLEALVGTLLRVLVNRADSKIGEDLLETYEAVLKDEK